MKILQICNRVPYPPKDGGAIAMYNMAKSFLSLGCELKILSFNTKKHFIEEKELPLELREKAQIETVYLDAGVKPLNAFLNLFTKKSYNISRFDNNEFKIRLIKTLQNEKFDIVHIEGLFMSMYVPVIRQYSKAGISMRAHNVEYIIWERLANTEKSFFKKCYLNLLLKRLKKYEISVLNDFDAIIPITHEDARVYKANGCKVPMHVSTAGVNQEVFKPDHTRVENASVFHLGALDWMPNQQAIKWFVEKIWPNVLKIHKEAKFYIAGRHIPAWVNKWNATQNIIVVGEVENAVEFMNKKQLMVVPLQSGSGMRLKIIEGMALGKAIVSTSVGAEGIDYTDQENIMIADDENKFAEQINLMLSNENLMENIQTNAIELVNSKYTNEKIVRDLINFYKNIL